MGKKFNLTQRTLVKETMNTVSGRGIIRLVKSVFITTVIFETIGAIFSFIVFIQDYPFWKALGMSIFHSIASFNNSGFDIFGGFQSLSRYSNNVLLNITTMLLIIFGGLGFLVIQDLKTSKLSWKKLSFHSKIVISTSLFLILIGTVLIKLTEGKNITLLGAIFQSVTARTAGFATYDLSVFSVSSIIIMMVLMLIV